MADKREGPTEAITSAPITVSEPPETVEATFRALVKQWKKDTEVMSSIARMTKHPAYQQIIDMGEAVIPLLLAELKREPDFWFAALQKLTGVDPVPKEHAGKIKLMAKAWLEWASKRTRSNTCSPLEPSTPCEENLGARSPERQAAGARRPGRNREANQS